MGVPIYIFTTKMAAINTFCLQPRRVLLDILLEPDPGVGPGAGHAARGAAGSGRPGLPHRPAQPPGGPGQAG